MAARVNIYRASRTYFVGHLVLYSNAIYRAKGTTIGNLPTNTNFWAPTVTLVAAATALTVAALTSITTDVPGTPDYAIATITGTSPKGFASVDEGLTVLTVIRNLQLRLAELEAACVTAGVVTLP